MGNKISAILIITFLSFGCAAKNAPDTKPKPPSIVGEYQFTFAGVGAGHGHVILPEIYPFGPNMENLYLVPRGTFTFNSSQTFRIQSFRIIGLAYPLRDNDEGEEIISFSDIVGTYEIRSDHTIMLRTAYGSSLYLYSLSMEEGYDGHNRKITATLLSLMPAHPYHPLWVGDDSSPQGRSLFDLMYLNKTEIK
jgi:hypothetical protein